MADRISVFKRDFSKNGIKTLNKQKIPDGIDVFETMINIKPVRLKTIIIIEWNSTVFPNVKS